MADDEPRLAPQSAPASGPAAPDDEDGLSHATLVAILAAVEAGDAAELTRRMEPLHAADIADLLEQIGTDERRALLRLYGHEFDGEILSEIDESIREEIVAELAPEVLSEAVRELETDDVVDLIEDLEPTQQEAVLDALAHVDRIAVERAMAYPERSAGRLMQRELVMGPEHWTVGAAIDYLRGADDLPDQFYHLILVNPRMEPVANVTLGRILSSKRDVTLRAIAEPGFRTFRVDEDEADIAYAFNQYHLISAPVVDAEGRLAGVITIDDAMNVLDEEHEEDILRLGGVGEGSLSDTVIATVQQRFPWLFVNLVSAILASSVISRFEDAIGQFVALAVLMPIVASVGGNAGTQCLTVTVRALATRSLTRANLFRVTRREVMVGLANGLIFAAIMSMVGIFWFDSPLLAAALAGAMILNHLVAGIAGIGVPVVLDWLRVDPALASGSFVTTMTDVVGFFAFLGLASVILLG